MVARVVKNGLREQMRRATTKLNNTVPMEHVIVNYLRNLQSKLFWSGEIQSQLRLKYEYWKNGSLKGGNLWAQYIDLLHLSALDSSEANADLRVQLSPAALCKQLETMLGFSFADEFNPQHLFDDNTHPLRTDAVKEFHIKSKYSQYVTYHKLPQELLGYLLRQLDSNNQPELILLQVQKAFEFNIKCRLEHSAICSLALVYLLRASLHPDPSELFTFLITKAETLLQEARLVPPPPSESNSWEPYVAILLQHFKETHTIPKEISLHTPAKVTSRTSSYGWLQLEKKLYGDIYTYADLINDIERSNISQLSRHGTYPYIHISRVT